MFGVKVCAKFLNNPWKCFLISSRAETSVVECGDKWWILVFTNTEYSSGWLLIFNQIR